MSSDLTKKCRTCMQEDNCNYQLHDIIEEEHKILEMLDGVVPQIQIKTESPFSSSICLQCVDKLLVGYKFQRLCIETDNHFRRLVGLSPLLEDDLKPETVWDPLMEEERTALKVEKDDAEANECIMNADNVEVILKCDNDLEGRGDVQTADGSDTDSSNEKLSILKLKEKKLKVKRTIGKYESTSNFPCTRLRNHQRTVDANKRDNPYKSSSAAKKTNRVHQKRCHKEKGKELPHPNNGQIEEDIDKEVKGTQSELANEEIFEEPMDFNDNHEVYEEDDSADPVDDSSNNKDVKNPPEHRIGEIEKPNTSSRRHTLPCEVCGKIFDRPSRLKRHSSVHSLDKPYACEICKNRFSSETYLKAHKMKHISQICDNMSAEVFKCPHCPRIFEKHGSLRIHLQVHRQHYATVSYPCQMCQRVFVTTKSLIKHITNEHPEAEKYACDQCDKTFVLKSHLVEHQSRHKGNRKLMCVICDKEYKFKSTLEKHMRSHSGERPYLCPECGKTFKCSSNLSEHMVRHAGLKIFQCPECPRRFKCRSDLTKHAPTHTNAKPHVCDICGSRFTRAHSLHHHKRLHSGERKFKCDKCSMSFSTKHHLVRHMRTHTGEKPYKCKYCDRAYAVGGDLTKHLRTHVGEKTYVCSECPMAFKYHSELRQHLSEHYKKALKDAQETTGEVPEVSTTMMTSTIENAITTPPTA